MAKLDYAVGRTADTSPVTKDVKCLIISSDKDVKCLIISPVTKDVKCLIISPVTKDVKCLIISPVTVQRMLSA